MALMRRYGTCAADILTATSHRKRPSPSPCRRAATIPESLAASDERARPPPLEIFRARVAKLPPPPTTNEAPWPNSLGPFPRQQSREHSRCGNAINLSERKNHEGLHPAHARRRQSELLSGRRS